MKCPFCGEEMKEGYLYSSKDGALSFSKELPGVFSKASNAEGFVRITELKAGSRSNVKASVCEKCRRVICEY